MFEALIEALLLEAMFDNWLQAITTKPTKLNESPAYREWAKGIFIARLELAMEHRS